MFHSFRNDEYIAQGDTLVFNASILQDAWGNPISDATGWRMVVTVKVNPTDIDSAAVIHAFAASSIVSGNVVQQSVSTAVLTPGGRYVYDVRLISPLGQVFTYCHGNLFIGQPITDTVPTSYDAFEAIEGVTLLNATCRIYITGGAYWLQLLDSATHVWTTVWLVNGAFTVGALGLAATAMVRVNGGFMQLWDVGAGAWRSVWWVNAAFTYGPTDSTTADGNPALGMRVVPTAITTQIQLIDQGSADQFRAMILTNGILTFGGLVS